MENRILYKGPPDLEAYRALIVSDVTSATTGGVGSGFATGTVIGFFYNFIKPNCGGFKSRLCNALVKAPCIGGNFALFSLGHCLSRNAYFKYSGVTPHGDAIPYEIHCAAIGGAFGFARYGLRSASIAALTSAGLMACVVFHDTRITRYGSSICKTNTYTYPHYRHPHHPEDEDNHIPWQEALFDAVQRFGQHS